jgi:uncharacterized membrane protein YdjX (TVP38/TMEM64 family)
MIIEYEKLKEVVGGTSIEDVAARLSQAGIPYIIGKRGRPFTTEDALNHTMGLSRAPLPPTEKMTIEIR